MAIVGLPGCGKSTIFNILALDQSGARVTAPDKPRITTVRVPDPRVDWLSSHYKPKKTTLTSMEFIDLAPPRTSGHPGEAFSAAHLAALRSTDGMLLTLGAFNGQNPVIDDLQTLDTEFLLADLQVAEKAVERLRTSVRKGRKEDARELSCLETVMGHLEAECPLRDAGLSDDDKHIIRGYAFLTQKPCVILLNLDEGRFKDADSLVAEIEAKAEGRPVLALSACIEEEIGQLDKDDQSAFMAELGINEPARARLIRQCFELLGLIVFFTVGEDEVRAWTLAKGRTALKAAGCIHSDLERGFIRAEVFAFEDLKRLGNVPTVKKEGLWHLEGKNYVVRDGDILCIRFNA